MGQAPSLLGLLQTAPDRPALLAEGRAPLLRSALRVQTAAIAAQLRAAGVERTDRVAVVLPNGPEMAACFLGIASAAACAPLNPGYRESEFEFYFDDLEPALLVVPAGLQNDLTRVARRRGMAVAEVSVDPGAHAGVLSLAIESGRGRSSSAESLNSGEDVALVLHTSGTTSRAKVVPLTHHNLCTSARHIAASLALRPQDRCLNVMPLFHIHGLVGALLSSIAAEASVVCTEGFLAPNFLSWLERHSPTWYTAVPTMHRAILSREEQRAPARTAHTLRFIRSSSAALPVPLLEGLERAFGVPVIEAYGMTEASHQMTANPLPPRRRKPGSVGLPAGIEVSILSDDGQVMGRMDGGTPTGEVVIRGGTVLSKYAANPAANRDAFIQGWFRTGDLGRLDEDGYLFLTGRAKEMINRGGEKISPREVDDALTAHPAVEQALAFALPDAELGEDVGAAVVLREAGGITESELRHFAATLLAPFKVPRRIVFLDEIPKGPTGKPQRIGLAERLGLTSVRQQQSRAPYRAPDSPLERDLSRMWSEALGLERVGLDDDFFACGGDSMLAGRVLAALESARGIRIPQVALFEHPTLAAFAHFTAQTASAAGLPADLPAPVRPVAHSDRGAGRPLSYAQERMWFLAQYESDPAAYVGTLALRLAGRVDQAVLRRSFESVLSRHEVLRTVYRFDDAGLTQTVAEDFDLPWRVIDLPTATTASVSDLAAAEERVPFDLSRELPIRAVLVRAGPDLNFLLLTIHHVTSDGWSKSVLRHDLATLYEDFMAGRESSLPDLPIQYADFAAWERERLAGDVMDRLVAFWRKTLAGSPPLLQLPLDYTRPADETFGGGTATAVISTETLATLETVCREERATLFMGLLSIFQVLLSRHSGMDDIVVGSPVASRPHEAEPLIGLLMNSLALRTDLSGEPTFRALLARVRAATLAAFEHQDAPFAAIVQALQPVRATSHTPIYQVLFNMKSYPDRLDPIGPLGFEDVAIDRPTVSLDLELDAAPIRGGLRLSLKYNTGLFARDTAVRLLEQFQVLLDAACLRPEDSVMRLPMLTGREQQLLLVEWNRTAVAPPEPWRALHQIIEAQAGRTPDRVALVFEQHVLSYRELEARANRLAHALVLRGVGPNAIVGVCLDRSIETTVGLLGVLKAGGAYVPVDPAYPRERVAHMLSDAGVSVLLTDSSLSPSLAPAGAEVISLDQFEWSSGDETLSPVNPGPEDLAYVLYTSGSTGRPKGVEIPHAAICNHMRWMDRVFPLAADDRVLQKTPISADASVWEFFAPLMAGATLVMAPVGAQLDPAALTTVVREQNITVLQVVPAMLRLLLDEPGFAHCRSLRRLFCGGEVLPRELAETFARTMPWATLINLYGPTEVTIDATYAVAQAGESTPSVPIGRPVDNTQCYILDERQQLVPVGAAGELYLGGAQVARGYHGRPDLTAERFIRDPFLSAPPARLYRTGDLCRYLPDGRIEHLGRLDHQVKIRGFRFELGEIEAALRAHPGVRDAVVLLREDIPGDQRLVAYVTGDAAPADLRALVARRLPDYAVPAAFVPVERMPLAPGGKIDRRALPAPAYGRSIGEPFVPPRTPTEQRLAGIWREVLGITQVAALDDFFLLGGHSLLALSVMHKIREEFGVALAPNAIFREPTLEGLARVVDERTGASRVQPDAGAPSAPLGRMERSGTLPASFAQERMWYLTQYEADPSGYVSTLALKLTGRFDAAVLRQAFAALLGRHEVLRTIYRFDGTGLSQIVLEDFALPWRELDAPQAADPWLSELAGDESRRPFDLSRELPIRAVLVRAATDAPVLLVLMHHVAYDGWSKSILRSEIAALYDDVAAGRETALPALPVQYVDFAAWERGRLTGDSLARLLSFWCGALAGSPPLLQLPLDHPRPAEPGPRGGKATALVPAENLAQFEALCRSERATLFMGLLAVFQILLSRHSGMDDIVVGSPIANRPHHTEGLVGLFMNTVALRTDVSGHPDFRTVLARTRATTLAAFDHQDAPFATVVQAMQPDRATSYSPIYQVLFNMKSYPDPRQQLGSLGFEELSLNRLTSAFDLELDATPAGDALRLDLKYNADLFDALTINRMLGHFTSLLDAVLLDPAPRIHDLPMLSAAERRQVLIGWNDTAVAFEPACVHALVEAQVARSPAAVAVRCGDDSITYGALDARANQLARAIRSRGVGPGTLAGICLAPSIDEVVATLAVAKAGGAFVPLDPQQPRERLRRIMDDAAPVVVITRQEYADTILAGRDNAVCLDREIETIRRESSESLGRAGSPDELFYVMYTSGSTGAPKGVMMPHRAVCNRLLWAKAELTVAPGDRMLRSASLAFDASISETFEPLVFGAEMIMAPLGLRDPRALINLIREHDIVVIDLVPAVLEALVSDPEFATCRSLKRIMNGGEALTAALTRKTLACLDVTLSNGYGPTETCVDVTWWHVTRATIDELGDRPVPIGRPLHNVRAYVLDASRQPVPVGVTGELYIAGACLADGYWKRPDLTAEAFVDEPFSGIAGSRMYRTGDRARFRSDGAIEFFGRADGQVKIRGVRIEPAEVEAAFRQIESIRDVAVVAIDGARGARLAAYVATDGSALDEADIRRQLRDMLPDAMIPSAIVPVVALPRTVSGKLDRSALPKAPDRPSVQPAAAPATPAEIRLAGIWRELLGVEEVQAGDDFFALGGHSLLAMALIHRVHEAFGVALAPNVVFREPTVAGQARLIEQAESAARAGSSTSTSQAIVQLEKGGPGTPFFWVHGIGGEVFSYMQVSRHLGAHRPVYGFAADWTQVLDASSMTVENMAARLVAEMRAVQPSGPYYLGGFCSAAMLVLEMARQLEAAGQAVGLAAILDYDVGRRKRSPSGLGAALAFARNVPNWVRDDAIPSGSRDLFGRIRSKLRRARGGDVRDRFGMWRFPDHQAPMLEAHGQAFERHVPGKIKGQIALFFPRTQPLWGPWPTSHSPEWSGLAAQVDAESVPGSHSTLLTDPFARQLAAQLNAAIERAPSRRGSPRG